MLQKGLLLPCARKAYPQQDCREALTFKTELPSGVFWGRAISGFCSVSGATRELDQNEFPNHPEYEAAACLATAGDCQHSNLCSWGAGGSEVVLARQ